MSFIATRDSKYFNVARNVALRSDFKIQVGAVAVYKNKVIATACSKEKTHPLQNVYNKYRDFEHTGLVFDKLHAEIELITKLKKQNVCLKNVSVYVYRVCKKREHGMSRPCAGCMQALLDAGITKVHYSTDVGFAYEELDVKMRKHKEGSKGWRNVCFI